MAGTLTISGIAGNSATWINDGYFPTGTWVTWKGDTIYPPDGYVWSPFITERKEVKEMRGLFHVILVNYKTEDIWDRFVIADSVEKAKIKALLCCGEDNPDMEVDDLDIICNKLGDVRKRTEITPVRVVSGD